MGNEKLQTLSRQYARGEIAKPEYRQKRALIINEVTGAIVPESSSSASSVQASAPATQQETSNLFFKAGVISAVIVAALILVYISI